MRNIFRNLSIYKRTTLAYVVFILVPSLLINIYSYQQIDQSLRNEFVQAKKLTLQHAKSNIESKVEIVESVADNICYNNYLINFLNEAYIPSISYDEYNSEIKPIVEYAMLYHKVNIDNILIYMQEPTIPQGYGLFFSEEGIADKAWLASFKASDARTVWLHAYEEFDNTYYRIPKNSYLYVSKITTLKGQYLGLCVIRVSLNEIFKMDEAITTDNDIIVMEPDGHILYPDGAHHTLPSLNDIYGHFILDKNIYVYDTIHALDQKIILKTPPKYTDIVSSKVKSLSYMIIASNIILMIMFYHSLQRVFKKIHKNLNLMDDSIKHDFKHRIPVESRDELGQISEKFNILLDRINLLVSDMIKKNVAHKNAQLKALQYQINPHFIYNTLGIFAGKMELEKHYELSEAMTEFSNMLRYIIKRESPYSTIENEIKYVRSYISIQRIRYENQIHLTVDLDDAIKDQPIINFILQPIVENSILHGFTANEQNVLEITIKGKHIAESNLIQLEIIDNGKGLKPKALRTLNRSFQNSTYKKNKSTEDSIGLKNINERLKLFYGLEYYIRVSSKPNACTKFIIHIPLSNIREAINHA